MIKQRKGIRMKKNVGKPTVSKAAPSRTNTLKTNPSRAGSVKAGKPSYSKRKRPVRGYSGPADYESYVEPSLTQNGGGSTDTAEGAALDADRAAAAPAQGAGSFLSLFGGVDGIISMMTKANQVFKLFQQMGPMFKMIGSFASSKAVTASLKPGGRRQIKRRRKKR